MWKCIYVCLSNERILFGDVWKHVQEQVPRTLGLETEELKYWQEVSKEKPQYFIKTKYNGRKRKAIGITETRNTHREFRNA